MPRKRTEAHQHIHTRQRTIGLCCRDCGLLAAATAVCPECCLAFIKAPRRKPGWPDEYLKHMAQQAGQSSVEFDIQRERDREVEGGLRNPAEQLLKQLPELKKVAVESLDRWSSGHWADQHAWSDTSHDVPHTQIQYLKNAVSMSLSRDCGLSCKRRTPSPSLQPRLLSIDTFGPIHHKTNCFWKTSFQNSTLGPIHHGTCRDCGLRPGALQPLACSLRPLCLCLCLCAIVLARSTYALSSCS